MESALDYGCVLENTNRTAEKSKVICCLIGQSHFSGKILDFPSESFCLEAFHSAVFLIRFFSSNLEGFNGRCNNLLMLLMKRGKARHISPSDQL